MEPPLPASSPLLIRCEFRSRGYTPEEIDLLRSDLEEIAVLQPRRLQYPEAGASYDIWLIVQWGGLAVLSGVIGNAAYDLLRALSKRLCAFYKRKEQQPNGLPPDIHYLEFRFDDIDLRLHGIDHDDDPSSNFLSFPTLLRLPEILAVVFEHVETEPLCSSELQALDVQEPHPTRTSNDCGGFLFTRPWRVEGVLQCQYSDYYPHERRLAERPGGGPLT